MNFINVKNLDSPWANLGFAICRLYGGNANCWSRKDNKLLKQLIARLGYFRYHKNGWQILEAPMGIVRTFIITWLTGALIATFYNTQFK